ncbi:MAG: GNAT family N-acetyltransferase [Actinobacteria bacterium]|nr:GNAT family N-acetyltransferase [Actinomycetota bacterium]
MSRGIRIQLVPCEGHHLEDLHRILNQPGNVVRWRFHGALLASEEFVRSLQAEDSQTFVAIERGTSRVLGLACTYGVNLRHGYAYIAVAVDESVLGGGYGAEAGALLISYLFETFPFRKLYMEIPDFTVASVEGRMTDAFQKEGVLRSHFLAMGSYWDTHIFAVYREQWLLQVLSGQTPTADDLQVIYVADDARAQVES